MSFLDLLDFDKVIVGKDEKTYKFTPPTIRELVKFVNWVKWKPYVEALEAGVPKEDLTDLKAKCEAGIVTELVNISENGIEDVREYEINFGSSIVQKELFQLDGLCKILQLSLNVKHPGVDLFDVIEEEEINEIFEDICTEAGIIIKKSEQNENTEKNE